MFICSELDENYYQDTTIKPIFLRITQQLAEMYTNHGLHVIQY